MSWKRPKKPPKWEEMTRDQMQDAVKKKRERESKAQNIVIGLLEREIAQQHFVECLPHVTQRHYDDIVEERSLVKLCGYPLCPHDLPSNIPKQQFKISHKSNKVYDLSNRKNFCSNFCFRASTHIKKQIPTSPLWFRDAEDIPDFVILTEDLGGGPGDAVDLGTGVYVSPVTVKDEPFATIMDFTNASLLDVDENIKLEALVADNSQTEILVKSEIPAKPESQTPKTNSQTEMKVKSEMPAKPEGQTLETKIESTALKKKPKAEPNLFNIIGEVVEKPTKEPILPPKHMEAETILKNDPKMVPIIQVERYFSQWFNLETLIFLFGEAKVKEMVSHKGDCIKEYLNNMSNGLYYSAESYDNYQKICRKLKVLELDDMRYDKTVLKNRETKPLIDYESLKEASKEMELKVKAYYAGETEIIREDTPETSEKIAVIEKTSQNALRRKIVLNSLHKVLPDLTRSLNVSSSNINSDIRLLINTFDLKANNIIFKHAQWYLVAIILIKLLSIRDDGLRRLLESPTAYKHLQLLLLSYGQDGGYLDRLIMWLTDIDRLLSADNASLTIPLQKR